MKRILLICLISFFGILTSKAQYSMDFGINLGGSNYLGEIGGASGEARPFLLDMQFSQANIAIGGFYRYNFTHNIAAKVAFNYARISGADSLSSNPERIGRNLSFRTDLFEFAITGEFTFFSRSDLARRTRSRIDFAAYGFTGVGILFYYPYAQHNDKWYYLRPLATEGIENSYDEMTIAVPLGLGLNFTFNRKTRIGFEVGYRFTMTDYLDDVSTNYAADSELPFQESFLFSERSDEAFARGNADLPNRGFYGYNASGARRGNPDTNDGYLLYQFSISYVISTNNAFGRSRYRSVINRRKKRTKF